MSWLIALFSRIGLLYLWIWTPLINKVFHGGWILPLLGIIFLPVTTLVYLFVYVLSGDGVTGWGWVWVVMALIVDLGVNSHPARSAQQKRNRRVDRPTLKE